VLERTIATHFFQNWPEKRGKRGERRPARVSPLSRVFLAASALIPLGIREDDSDSFFPNQAIKRGKRGERRWAKSPSGVARIMLLRPTG
jgi:hypothetical protein